MTKQRIPDGDLMGFDLASLEAEAPEVREPRQPQGRGRRNDEQKSGGRGEKKPARAAGDKKPAEGRGGEQRSSTEGAGKGRRTRGGQGRGKPQQAAGAAIRPALPPERDPEEFLDDEIDNFGNRVDYVPPANQAQNGRGRRGGQANAGGNPRPARGGAGANAGGKPAGGQNRKKGGAGGRGKPQGSGRVLTPNGSSGNSDSPLSATPRRSERQPVIIHKHRERLPSLEQLDELPDSRPRGEKPALLTRNR